MNALKLFGAIGAACLVSALGPVQAADTSSQPASGSESPPPAGTNQPPVLYKPRTTGLKRQVNAGSRGGDAPQAGLAVLAPDDLGLATGNQPVLWWYLAEPSTNKVEFTLNHDFQTLVKTELPDAASPGLHRIDLARLSPDAPIRLESGTYYQWTLRLRSGDDPAVQPVSLGWVQWVAPGPDLARQLADAPPGRHPALYAAGGYWYDAVDQLAATLAQNATDAGTAAGLRSLLDQAGLKQVRLGGAH